MHRLTSATLTELEHTAVQLARLAGAHIVASVPNEHNVRFKSAARGTAHNANPVCDVDHEIETHLRQVLGERFPTHAVVGEEGGYTGADDAEFAWVIDPLDGTTNFLNGLPLYAASIAVLFRHVPIAGAVWGATTHALRPGVYHAREGAPLQFDGAPVVRRAPGTWRGLATEPGSAPRYAAFFDTRVLACASLECAFVGAGLLQFAYIAHPASWDVAAGLVLARAAGCRAVTRRDGAWLPFTAFSAPTARKRTAALFDWRQPVLIGEAEAIGRESAVAAAIH